jgi:integrase/recombinase XerD
LASNNIFCIEDVTPNILRDYFNELKLRRNTGGVHAAYRAIKVLFFFYEFEYEPENYHNPFLKVKIPTPKIQPLKGIAKENVQKLLDVCEGRNLSRNKAMLACLASSGCRANEFLDLNIEDVNLITGSVRIKHGKGDKYRITFIGKEAIKLLRKYLAKRTNLEPETPLWLNESNERMTVSGLRYLAYKYSKIARIPHTGLHDFRRCFALSLYRKGVEILIISQLLGHANIETTKRYLNITEEDLHLAHMKLDLFD